MKKSTALLFILSFLVLITFLSTWYTTDKRPELTGQTEEYCCSACAYADDITYDELPAPEGYVWTEVAEEDMATLMPDHLFSDMTEVWYIQGQDTIKLHFTN